MVCHNDEVACFFASELQDFNIRYLFADFNIKIVISILLGDITLFYGRHLILLKFFYCAAFGPGIHF